MCIPILVSWFAVAMTFWIVVSIDLWLFSVVNLLISNAFSKPWICALLPESQGWGSLVGFHLWGRSESDTTEATWQQQQPQKRTVFDIMSTSDCFFVKSESVNHSVLSDSLLPYGL